MYRCATKFSWF